eukprot:2966706-Pleurochrysis_carterae.AAC.2
MIECAWVSAQADKTARALMRVCLHAKHDGLARQERGGRVAVPVGGEIDPLQIDKHHRDRAHLREVHVAV